VIGVVYDANVLVSGLAGYRIERSTPGALVRAWQRGEVELFLSEHILGEVTRTLSGPYFRRRLSEAQIVQGMATLRLRSRIVSITEEMQGVATHPEDDLILATVVSARVDYLVTGDAQLQKLQEYQGVRIVSPRAFQDVLEEGRSS
jgi:uncharacterized protein